MLLTKSEQKKVQLYIEKQMILDHELIENLFGDPDLELTFMKHMIEKNYEKAFKLCTEVQDVWLNLNQMQVIINYIDPTINQIMSKYCIFYQTDISDDFEQFDSMYKQIEIKLYKMYQKIYF